MIFSGNNKKEDKSNSQEYIPSAPEFNYVHTTPDKINEKNKEYNIIVLWWISKKKSGYDVTTSKYPKWFMDTYNINFGIVAQKYINNGCLEVNDHIIKITSVGEEEIKKYDYIVYIHEHPQYELKIKDFLNNENLHKVRNEDIVWGVFNKRILIYSQKRMWTSLGYNYSNMASLLIEEKKYEYALPFIFASSYIETSGMKDNNELAPIDEEWTNRGKKKTILNNGIPDICFMEINNYLITAPFMECMKNLNYNWEDIRKSYISCSIIVNDLENCLPFRYFEKEESFEFFKEAIENAEKKGVFSLKMVKKTLKTNKPNENSKTYFYASVDNKFNLIKRKI